MEVANQDNPINTKYPNVDFSLDASKQLPQKTAEELKQQRENFRKETFFTSLTFTAKNAMHNGNINNQYSEHLSVFDTLGTANFSRVKDIFIQEVNKFIKVTKYFAGNKYIEKLKILISRIQSEKEPEGENKLIDHLRCCVLSLHDLTLVLNNLKYQLEQNKTSTKNIFSKATITFYLDACIVDLDKCWAGISSRFTHEYNCLSSLNGGISGRINIIKKELLDALLSEYLNAKKQEDPDLFIVGNEIHIRNTLNNAMHEILGIDKIEDPLEDKSLNAAVKQEFIELATIEISPARITSMLADNFYQYLTMILDKYYMNSWLTEYKSDDQILPDLCCKNEIKFKYVLADSWFSSKENMTFIRHKCNKHFVMALKSNRLVCLTRKDLLDGKSQRIDSLKTIENYPVQCWMSGINFPVLIYCQIFKNKDGSSGKLYMVCSDLECDADKIETIYKKRWKVELFHKT